MNSPNHNNKRAQLSNDSEYTHEHEIEYVHEHDLVYEHEHALGLPRRPNKILYWLGGVGLRALGGWRMVGRIPDVNKAIIAVAPHTSNWDFMVGLMVKFRLGLHVNFLGKHTLFRFPLKYFLTRIGGIPVRRDSANGVVGSMAEAFTARQQLILVVAPEGTRKSVSAWRTGFLHIAKQARVPVIPVAFDYAQRRILFGPLILVGDDISEALTRVQAFTAQAQGKIAENG